MKEVLFKISLLMIVSACLIACGGANSSQKLVNFVYDAELKSGSYNAQDWEKSMNQYDKLVEEYLSSGKTYTEEEKQMAAKAMGRYHSLLIKNSVKISSSYIDELKTILPASFEGLGEGLEENSDEIKKSLDVMFETEEIEESMEELNSQIEDIFNSQIENK